MKKISILFLLILAMISGCASQATNAHNSRDDELIIEIMKEKYRKNGPSMLCDQPFYLSCYELTKEQCISELSDNSDKCLETANEKFPKITSGNRKDYSDYYIKCVLARHLLMHADKHEEIGMCMKEARLDKKLLMQSLLK